MSRFMNISRAVYLCAGLIVWPGWRHGAWGDESAPEKTDVGNVTVNRPSNDAWGELRVRFVSEGLPERLPVPELGTGSSGASREGVRDAVIWLRRVSRSHDLYRHAGPGVLTVRDNEFIPHVLVVRVGETLKVRNRDAVNHIALIRPTRGRELNVLLAPGDERTWRFMHPEPFPLPVTSTFDPSMRGFIVVTDNPYVAVSDDDGFARLANVPAGEELEMRLWHETTGFFTRPGAPRGRASRIVVPADGVLDLGEIAIPTAFPRSSSDLKHTTPER